MPREVGPSRSRRKVLNILRAKQNAQVTSSYVSYPPIALVDGQKGSYPGPIHHGLDGGLPRGQEERGRGGGYLIRVPAFPRSYKQFQPDIVSVPL